MVSICKLTIRRSLPIGSPIAHPPSYLPHALEGGKLSIMNIGNDFTLAKRGVFKMCGLARLVCFSSTNSRPKPTSFRVHSCPECPWSASRHFQRTLRPDPARKLAECFPRTSSAALRETSMRGTENLRGQPTGTSAGSEHKM